MNIGMVCPYSLAVWGGVQAQVLGLSKALRKRGVEVQVLAPCEGQPPEPWVIPLGNSIPYAQNGSMAPLAPDPAAQFRMLGAIKDHRFDLLHLHEPLAPGPTVTSLIVKPVPLIGTFHVSGEVAAYKWAKPMLRRMVKKLDYSVAVSPEAAGMAQRFLGGSYDVLFNGIEIERFQAGTPWPTKNKTIVFLGRHEPRKGLAILLEALQQMPPDVELWVIGNGPETKRLKAQYSFDSRVSWLGIVSETEKIQRLQGADAFCIPSLGGESFGLVLLEGMAAGTPVVASDLPAYRAVTREGADATLFNTGSPESLAKALLSAVNHDSHVAQKVKSGLERVESFSMDSLAEAYLGYYQQILGL